MISSGNIVKANLRETGIVDMTYPRLSDNYIDSIIITDGDANVIYVSDIMAMRMGESSEKIIGRNIKDLIAEGLYDDHTVLTAIYNKKEAISALGTKKSEFKIVRSSPVLDDDGNVSMVVTTNISSTRNQSIDRMRIS